MPGIRQSVEIDGESLAETDCSSMDKCFGGTAALLTGLLNGSTAGVALFDRSLRCRGINNILRRMIGALSEEPVGQPMHRVFPGIAPKLDLAFRRAFNTGDSLANVELTAQLPAAAEPRRWLVNLCPIRNADGQVRLVAATFFEITKRRCLEMKLSRLRDKFQMETPGESGCVGKEFSALSTRTFEIVQTSMVLLANSMSLRLLVSEARLEAGLAPHAVFSTAARHQEAEPLQASALMEMANEQSPARLSPNETERPTGDPSFRERQVLRLLADGKSNKEIGAVLNLCTRTVETYRARIMVKLDLHSTAALVRYAIRQRIVEA